jgi:hypothetical protein
MPGGFVVALVLLLPPSVLSIGKAGDIVDVSDEKAESLVRGGWGRRLYHERGAAAKAKAAAHREEAEKFAGNIRDALPTTVTPVTPQEQALLDNPETLDALKRGIAQAKAGDIVVYDLSIPDDDEDET